MRNPERIYPLTRLLYLLWSDQPDMRLGQLLTTLCGVKTDIFNVEDDATAALLLLALKGHKIPHGIDYPFPTTKWWLISNEDAELIQNGLGRLKEASHERSFAGTVIDDILHTLDAGLHTTEEVPEDFRDE